jgi:hypothetical protein
VGQKALYYSDDKKDWYECIVMGPDSEGGVQVNISNIRTVSPKKLSTHLRSCSDEKIEGKSGKSSSTVVDTYTVGQKALYYSEDKKDWFECTVVGTDENGGKQVNINGNTRAVPLQKLASHLRTLNAAGQYQRLGTTAKTYKALYSNSAASSKALYFSDNKNAWFECTVIGPDALGGMQVDVEGNRRTVPAEKIATHFSANREAASASAIAAIGPAQGAAWFDVGYRIA